MFIDFLLLLEFIVITKLDIACSVSNHFHIIAKAMGTTELEGNHRAEL